MQHGIMNMQARNQYLHTLITQGGGYHTVSRTEKSRLLDDYCRITGQNRKWVIQKIRSGAYVYSMRKEKGEEKRTRKSRYDHEVVSYLIMLWNIFDRPCGQRMVAQIRTELYRLIQFDEIRISDAMAGKLMQISSAEIDRSLATHKEKEHCTQKYGKKIHPLLYQKIPVRIAAAQDRKTVGNIQIDLVEHCGQRAEGTYIYTLSTTDLATSWWEGGAVLSKGMHGVVCMLDALKERYPFPWVHMHSDNDSAFINGHLYRYSQKEVLEFSRSRPYEKNDNFLVEQKNGRVVRRTIGYRRHDTTTELIILNRLYHDIGLYQNFFQPVAKLKEKKRIGSIIKRTFEKPTTPYQRVMGSRHVSKEKKNALTTLYASLNPAALKRHIDAQRDTLYQAYRMKRHTVERTQKVDDVVQEISLPSVRFLHDVPEAVSVR